MSNEESSRNRRERQQSFKSQITCTIFVTESGSVLPVQMIFGGTTHRCYPGQGKEVAPHDVLWAHTKSHWQTPESFMELVEKVVIPYKTCIIKEHNLQQNQVSILKIDVHYCCTRTFALHSFTRFYHAP